MTVGGMGFIPERLLMMMITTSVSRTGPGQDRGHLLFNFLLVSQLYKLELEL